MVNNGYIIAKVGNGILHVNLQVWSELLAPPFFEISEPSLNIFKYLNRKTI